MYKCYLFNKIKFKLTPASPKREAPLAVVGRLNSLLPNGSSPLMVNVDCSYSNAVDVRY